MTTVLGFLGRTQGKRRFAGVDLLTYLYLGIGTIIMFGPILWLIMSSFKSQSELVKFPPTLLPYSQPSVTVPGYDKPLDLYNVTLDDGTVKQMALAARVGLEATMVDPAAPTTTVKVNIKQIQSVEVMSFNLDNYTRGVAAFDFGVYLRNSVAVTFFATILTLLVNSMAAFGLSKYRFAGRNAIFVLIVSTLLIPLPVILVPVFLVITQVGWNNNLLGVIVPASATPTGVFLLRQYMLTIPDELLDSARIDGASEWRIYWQIILPLATPALAVLAIFSVMWRWNDFLWPLIVLSHKELFTLPIALNSFQGQFDTQWDVLLAMTVLTLLPITVVFAFLQRFITTGIATTGLK
ncbi:MAG TPA: carbohydrate ABC transporter permease [Phototrophicaceae bacterium]|nr:carbohydrate ABC transporter permease [Phototrophicaceae bacterium]